MLLSNLDLLATAPGGVARLRELILSLAVQGKLVPQDPVDEPASVLLTKIRAEKDRLIAEGKIRRDKPLAEIAEDKLPCDLPEGWIWARLSELGDFSGGKTPSTQRAKFWDGDIPWITPKDMKQLRLSSSEDKVTQMAVDDGLALIPAHSVLIVVRSGILRRTVPTAVNEVATTINQDLKALVLVRPELASYVQLLIRGFERFILQNLTKIGTTVESIQFEAFAAQGFPIPPLAEQSRIVSRVEELMRLCDALEAKGQLEAAQHDQLVSTLLGALTASATPEELADNWQRVAQHFDLLLDRPQAIGALEQTLLQLAVRGLLVPQDPTDEPASELLVRVMRLKAASAGKSRKPTDDKLPLFPYELPDRWTWAQLGDLVENMGSGWSPACDEGERSDPTRWAVLRTTAVQVNEFRPREHKALPSKLSPRPEIEVQDGDILITRAGPMNRVGISCWVDQAPPRLMLSDKIVRFHPVANEMLPAFIVLTLNAGYTKDQIEAAKSGMAASQVNISQSDLRGFWIPVCSKTEQSRIVTRVTALRRLCADLRQRLAERQSVQARLAEALVQEVA